MPKCNFCSTVSADCGFEAEVVEHCGKEQSECQAREYAARAEFKGKAQESCRRYGEKYIADKRVFHRFGNVVHASQCSEQGGLRPVQELERSGYDKERAGLGNDGTIVGEEACHAAAYAYETAGGYAHGDKAQVQSAQRTVTQQQRVFHTKGMRYQYGCCRGYSAGYLEGEGYEGEYYLVGGKGYG